MDEVINIDEMISEMGPLEYSSDEDHLIIDIPNRVQSPHRLATPEMGDYPSDNSSPNLIIDEDNDSFSSSSSTEARIWLENQPSMQNDFDAFEEDDSTSQSSSSKPTTSSTATTNVEDNSKHDRQNAKKIMLIDDSDIDNPKTPQPIEDDIEVDDMELDITATYIDKNNVVQQRKPHDAYKPGEDLKTYRLVHIESSDDESPQTNSQETPLDIREPHTIEEAHPNSKRKFMIKMKRNHKKLTNGLNEQQNNMPSIPLANERRKMFQKAFAQKTPSSVTNEPQPSTSGIVLPTLDENSAQSKRRSRKDVHTTIMEPEMELYTEIIERPQSPGIRLQSKIAELAFQRAIMNVTLLHNHGPLIKYGKNLTKYRKTLDAILKVTQKNVLKRKRKNLSLHSVETV